MWNSEELLCFYRTFVIYIQLSFWCVRKGFGCILNEHFNLDFLCLEFLNEHQNLFNLLLIFLWNETGNYIRILWTFRARVVLQRKENPLEKWILIFFLSTHCDFIGWLMIDPVQQWRLVKKKGKKYCNFLQTHAKE